MRTTIRATCVSCGDVELRVEALVVSVSAPTDTTAYVFTCPLCGEINARHVSRRVADLLVSSGARLEVIDAQDAGASLVFQVLGGEAVRYGAAAGGQTDAQAIDREVDKFSAWLDSGTWLAELLADG